MNQLELFISFIRENAPELLDQTREHLMLTFVSLAFATTIGLTLGILISRYKKLTTGVIGFVNAVQTIPSIALLGFLLPLFGIGVVPAIIALFLYALLPIVRNTYTGIEEIDPAIKEAALGMGMNQKQLLLKVELPLAMPVIFAGIRTAFVINVGVATLCALIAAGGLGEFIFRGLSTNNVYMILAGAIPAALMALLFDWLMGVVQKNIYKLIRPIGIMAAAILIFLVLYNVLSGSSGKLKAGFPSEFIERADGYRGLIDTYNLKFEVNEMEIGLMYDAVHNGYVDVISGFSTEGRVKAYDLKILMDDKNYFPPYHAAPIVRQVVIDEHRGVEKALNSLAGLITDEEMAAMNYEVDELKKNIRQVAKEFLNRKGLKTGIERKGEGQISVASKGFTESFILAHMYEIVIENQTSLNVELKLGIGGTKLLFDAMNNGEIDIYPEYTGTGLLVILKEEADNVLYEKEAVYYHVSKAFQQQFNIKWLEPHGFNNTTTLMMRRQHAEELEVESISDLSRIN